jgi:hypothetical protein
MSYGVYMPASSIARRASSSESSRAATRPELPVEQPSRFELVINLSDRAQPRPRDFAVDPRARRSRDRMKPRSSLLRKYAVFFLALVIGCCSRAERRDLFHVPGAQGGAVPPAARKGAFGGDANRAIHPRRRARTRAARALAVEPPADDAPERRFEYRRALGRVQSIAEIGWLDRPAGSRCVSRA